jgi:hypothetical protein
MMIFRTCQKPKLYEFYFSKSTFSTYRIMGEYSVMGYMAHVLSGSGKIFRNDFTINREQDDDLIQIKDEAIIAGLLLRGL